MKRVAVIGLSGESIFLKVDHFNNIGETIISHDVHTEPGGKGFNQAFLDEIVAKNDIVSVISKYVTLTRRGSNYWACCPFHMEKTPSFSIKQDGQFFKCFGCGESGNVITLVMKMENVDFMTAVEILCKNCGMSMPSASEVPAGVGGTLNFTLCEAQYFTAASPLLHLAKPNFTEC